MNIDNDIFFTSDFQDVFEQCNKGLVQYYLLIKAEEYIALAVIQNINLDLDKSTSHLSITNDIAKKLRCLLNGKSLKINICGNLFMSAPLGLKVTAIEFEEQALIAVQDYLRKHKVASLNFIKDLYNKYDSSRCLLQSMDYHHFEVEPNMVLTIDPHWSDFDDYKSALKSKYRVKVNRAETLSQSLKTVFFNASDIMEHQERLQKLLENITEKALWRTIDLPISTYARLKSVLKESFVFKVYLLENKIVGFATTFFNQKQCIAHFIGIDYEVNKEHSVYPRILNDYVKIAIEKGCTHLNLGRTSAEIKSTLGAEPVDLHCYVRHKRSMANLIFKPLTRKIDVPLYKQHSPFKKKI